MGYDNRFTNNESVSYKDGDKTIVERTDGNVHIKATIPDSVKDDNKDNKSNK